VLREGMVVIATADMDFHPSAYPHMKSHIIRAGAMGRITGSYDPSSMQDAGSPCYIVCFDHEYPFQRSCRGLDIEEASTIELLVREDPSEQHRKR
jgi:hypothetical protein